MSSVERARTLVNLAMTLSSVPRATTLLGMVLACSFHHFLEGVSFHRSWFLYLNGTGSWFLYLNGMRGKTCHSNVIVSDKDSCCGSYSFR